MVTRKTRWMSGLVVLLMLVSLFTVFTMPVSAAGQADLKAEKGLVDKTSLPNIADGIKDGVKDYQINSRAGFDKMKEIWDTKNYEVHIYQTADIDMGWIPFAGISGNPKNISWESNTQLFDGNGFVIKNLLINAPDRTQVGLFNRCWSNTTIRNVGIASGLIIGWNTVGSIAGLNCGGNIINCWSAATIVTGAGGEGSGTGGIVGQHYSRYGNSADMVNCYFIGNLITKGIYASGLVGITYEDDTASTQRQFKNCYVGGQVSYGFAVDNLFQKETTNAYLPGYNALIRTYAHGNRSNNTANAGGSVAAANNYYRADGSGLKSYADAAAEGVKLNGATVKDVDAGKAVTSAEVADGTLASKLNTGDFSLGAHDGYTVKYVQTADGYPALGYYKGETLVACRTAAEGAACTSAEDLAAKGELFNAFVAKRNGGIAAGKLQNVTVKTANDLFALGVIAFQTGLTSAYIEGDITFTADVDCADCTFVPGCSWMFPIMSTTFDSVLDGKNHVIYNWKGVGIVYGAQPTAGLIRQADGATVKNLGMIDAYGEIEYSYGDGLWIYPALMIGQVNDDGTTTTTIENCFVTGHVEVTKDGSNIGAGSANNAGAIVGRVMYLAAEGADGPLLVMKNCWSDVDRTFTWNKDTVEFRTLGSTKIEYGTEWCPILDNVVYVAKDVLVGSADNTTDDYEVQPNVDASTADGSMAAYLNNTTIGVYYTVKNGKTVYGTAENATRTLTVNKRMENGTLVSSEKFYYNTGSTVTIPELSGYVLDTDSLPANAGASSFAMPAENWSLDYTAKGVDYDSVQDTFDELNKYDAALFVEEENIEAVADLFEAALAYADQEQTADVVAAANAAITNAMNAYGALNFANMTLKDTYPNVPAFADYELYKNYNPTNWGVSTKEDWIAATKILTTNFKGITIHLLNDVDMENVKVAPLGYGKYFDGTLDGHGYVFKNLKIEADTTTHVGLVSYLGGTGVVKNLGVASGSISAVYVNDCGVGGIAGAAEGGSQILNCWNGASVTGTGSAGISVAGIAGRGYANSVIDGCYNIGTITGINHAAGLNDWGQASAKIRNSFNYGTLNAGNTGVVRQNATADATLHVNSYALGTKYASEGSAALLALNAEPFMQDKEIYSNGVLAWMLNSNYTTGLKTYYTLQDGKTVFGTAANQTVRLTLKCNGLADEYIYINAGEQITLDYAENATYTVTSGEGSSVEGAVLTIGPEDVVVTVTIVGMNYKALDDAFAYYEARDVELYADGEEGNLAELIATLKVMKEQGQFQAQGMIDAYAALLMSYELKNEYPAFPAAKDVPLYEGANGFLVKDLADLEYVANNPLKFGAGTVIYLDADITVPAGSAANKLHNVAAAIDGKGHTITGVTMKNGQDSWLGSYTGAYVKNLVMDSWNGTGMAWQGALLVYNAGASFTIENVKVVNCSITGGANGLSFLVGIINHGSLTVTMKNIEIVNSTFDRNSKSGNSGVLAGRVQNGTLKVDGAKVIGTTVKGAFYGSGQGLVVGEVTGDATLKNIFVEKTTYSGEDCRIQGVVVGFFKLGGSGDDQTPSLALENIVVDDPANTPVVYRGNTSAVTFSATDVYGVGKLMAGSVEMAATTTAEQMASGELAYAANAKNYAMKWTMGEEGYPVPAEEGDALTHKIHFYAYDENDPDVSEEFDLYTDKNGKLVGLTQDLLNAATWADEATLAERVFTQDGIVTGVLAATHECVFGNPTHVDGTNTHVLTCTVDPACEETRTVDCVFETIEMEDENALPEDAAHYYVCACGNGSESELCCEGEGWYYDETCPEDCTEGYSVEASCDVCGYSYEADGVGARDDHEFDAWNHYAGNVHRRECAHCETVEQEACTFTGEWTETTAPQVGVAGEKQRPCDMNCGNIQKEAIDPLPEPAEPVQITVSAPETVEPGDDIVVEFFFENDPGIATIGGKLLYNTSELQLTGLATENPRVNITLGDEDAEGIGLNFSHPEPLSEEGYFFKAIFSTYSRIPEGDYTIGFEPGTARDENGEDVEVLAAETTVKIEAPVIEPPVFGLELPEKAAPGEEITVEIFTVNNPGVAGLLIDVLYDVDALTLTNVTAGDFEGAVEFLENEDGARLGFVTNRDEIEDGVLFVLTFTVADEADGQYLIDVVGVEGGIVNGENDPVEFIAAGGSLNVSNVLLGDVTGDGRVSISDAVMLLRIASGDTELPAFDMEAANVSTDGDTPEMLINTADVILLLQYLTGSVKEL